LAVKFIKGLPLKVAIRTAVDRENAAEDMIFKPVGLKAQEFVNKHLNEAA